MSEDKVYTDGDIVWVKLGNNWWPGEVTGSNRHPEGLVKHLKRMPYCVVKFFNENSYEYVRSAKQIFPFQCAKKDEFLRKGYSLYNSGNSFMEKFPADVEVAERLTRRKEPSLIINDRPDSIVKAILGQPLITTYDDCYDGINYREKRRSGDSVTKILNITQNRNNETSNNKLGISSISILTQPNSNSSSNLPLNNTKNVTNNVVNNNTNYQCNLCDFTSVRQNVMILHRKMHSNRNSIGPISTKLSSKPSPSPAPPPPPPASTAVATAVSTTSTTSLNKKRSNQNQIVSDDINKNITKVSTITTTKTRSDREAQNASIRKATTPKEPIVTNTSTLPVTKTIKSKSPKLNKNVKSNKESQMESAYATILSDFCPNETDDKQSRRSLRHRKNSDESTTTVDMTNGSSICIDITETRSIQKVPKKRDFSSLQLRKDSQTESSEPDVYIVDKDKETIAKSTSTAIINSAESTKDDVEDLRKILLADWSDDDETPPDAIVVEDSIVINEPNTNAVVAATSTPVVSSSSSLTGRIRNIPKKDRRDVVLQDFNSDISLIEGNNEVGESRKPMAADLDSSNSSVVEIIEDDQSIAPIITINDDEEDVDVTKTQNDQNTVVVCESQDIDSAVGGLANQKSNSAATSCSTLSCFDFQEEEDEQESAAPKISHFKKKYLSGEKLQNLSYSMDDIEDESLTKNRAELADSDQKLTAEIESLLAQTQPAVTDLLNANSLEESISVKDLPIKERGKRIFKSRNKSRIEERTTTDATTATVPVVDDNLKTSEHNNSNENSQLETIINKDNETSVSNQSENKLDNEIMLEVDENLTSKNKTIEITNEEITYNTSTDEPYLHNEPANENKENEDITKCDNNSTIQIEKSQLDKEKLIDCEEKLMENEITSEEIIKVVPEEETQIVDLSKKLVSEITTNETADEPNEDSEINILKEYSAVHLEDYEEEVKIDKHLNNIKENMLIEDIELDSNDKVEATKITESLEELNEIEQENKTHNEVETIETDNIDTLSTEESKIEIIRNDINTPTDNEEILPELKTAEEENHDISENENSDNVYKIRVKSSEKLFEPTFDLAPEKLQETVSVTEVSNVETRLITTTPTDENSSMGASDTGAEFGSPTSMLSEERLPAFRFESNQTPQQEIDAAAENDLQVAVENQKQTTHEETNHNVKTPIKELFNDFSLSSVNFPEISLSPLIQRRFSMILHSSHTEVNPIKRPRLSVDDSKMKNNMERPTGRNSPSPLLQFTSELNNRPKNRHMKITPRRNVSELFKTKTNGNGNMVINETTNCVSSIENSKTIGKIQETENESSTEKLTKISEENYDSENRNEYAKEQTSTLETVIQTSEQKVIPAAENVTSEEKQINENFSRGELNQQQDYVKENIVFKEDDVAIEVNATEALKDSSQSDKAVDLQDNCLMSKAKVYADDLPSKIITTKENQQNQNNIESNSHVANISSNIPEIDLIEADFKEKDYGTDDVHEPHKNESQEEDLSQVVNSKASLNEDSYITVNNIESTESNIPTPNVVSSLDKVETAFSPDVPPPTPQESEIVIESENANQTINDQQHLEEKCEENLDTISRSTTPTVNNQLNEENIQPETPNATNLVEEVDRSSPALDIVKSLNEDTKKELVDEYETKVPSASQKQSENIITRNEHADVSLSSTQQKIEGDEDHDHADVLPFSPQQKNDCGENPEHAEVLPYSPQPKNDCDESHEHADILLSSPQQNNDYDESHEHADVLLSSPQQKNDCDENETRILNSSTPQIKDFIIECEPQTPQGIIECDHNLPTQITPEKEVIIETDMASVIPEKDIIIEETIQIEEKESLIGKEFQEIPKDQSVQQETQATVLQTDADKAAEEFLIEFDNIVNHSHSVEEDTPNNSIEEVINAEDLISNIIEEVHEDHQLKQDIPRDKSPAPLQYDANTTYTVLAPKTSFNQIFKESFTKQSTPAKRRQTICFEISDTREGVACKKQALDFESILPVNRTLKRTAERKLTLPAIETRPSNSKQQHGIFALNHNQLTLNKKLIPTTKRKLSIEDNITSFIIERPKQQLQQQSQHSTTSGPPPLQRIRSLSHTNVATNEDTIVEPPPLQSHDNLYQELFHPIPSSPTPCAESSQRPETARVIHQQILTSPAVTSIPTKTSTDSKISKNKQIGIDSRGNKYVIIKTPPTDIIVQPTLTPSSTTAVTATNNFATTITIQPLPRNATETAAPTKSTKNKTSLTSSSVRKQQQQQQQMKPFSITVPAKSPVEIGKSSDNVGKTPSRNRRKATQTKALPTGTATTNSNVNSAKHRQAMEALSRRLSIASEAPPLAKISRTSTTHVQTHLSNTSNLTTFFGDTQISNIAQQQLIHLQQQQQQQQQQPTSQLPPPIILNKNAHQQSVIQRKPRKIAQQQQNIQQQQNFQQQQQNAAKTSQLLQLQQQQTQMQQQQLQQQFITQITAQQPQHQHNILQPPPLQQIQPQVQQQIVQQTDGIIITTAAEDDNVIDSNTQLIALPTQPYPGYSETFLLCKVKGNTCKPVDNVPLYLNHQLNELVPVPLEALEGGPKPPHDHQIEIKSPNTQQQQILTGVHNNAVLQGTENNLQMANITCGVTDGGTLATTGIETEHNHQRLSQNQTQQQIMEECVVEENAANTGNNQMADFSGTQEVNSQLIPNNGILLNIEGQQVLLDAATFAHLLANPDANTQLISDDGTEYVLTHEVLAALQMQQEQQQALELANAAAAAEQQQQHTHLEQTGGTDIIAVALASSDLYDNDVLTIDTSQGMQLIDGDGSIVFPQQSVAITQQHLTPPAVVTNAVLDQSPIMSTLEVPSSIAAGHKLQGSQLITVPSHHLAASSNAALGGRSNLEDSLAAIGVTTQSSSIPSSLGLPITVTNPNIASKVTSAGPLNEMLQFVSHRPATAAATAAAVAAAALAGESRIFTD